MTNFAPLPPHIYETMTGLDGLLAMIRGDLPAPTMARALAFRLIEASHGFAVFEGEASDEFLNPHGTVHGGWAASLLDSALGCAVHSTLAVGERFTTVEMKVNYLRPVLPGKTGLLRCEGQVIHRGRTLALGDARLIDGAGKLYAHATETCMIFPKT